MMHNSEYIDSRTPIRAVLFDAGNTLFYEQPSRFEIYERAARDLGLGASAGEVKAAMHREHQRVPPVDGENARYTDRWFREYVPAVFRSLGAPESALSGARDALLDRYRKTVALRLFPESLEVLDELRAAGARLGILSNWSPRLLLHLDHLGLAGKFDAVLVSAIEGVEKPAREFFARGCARLGVAPREAVHVGDHRENDLAGARAAGLHALLVDRGAAAPADAFTIRNLKEIREKVSFAT